MEQGRFLQSVTRDVLASGPKASRHRGQVDSLTETKADGSHL